MFVPRSTDGTNDRAICLGLFSAVAKSSPALKESPAPVSTTARSVLSSRNRLLTATSSASMSRVRPLSLSGRSSQTLATPSSTVQVMFRDRHEAERTPTSR
jgi:hypothetical protein